MSTKSKIDVTIVVAHYNREDIVLDTLNSIKGQTFNNFECLVIDDCSNDGSPDLIREFCRQDPRFLYKRNKKNSGKCFSYNRGIGMARGKYIMFIDNDDIFDKEYVSVLYNLIVKDNTDMAVCNYNIWYCDTGKIVTPTFHPDSIGGGVRRYEDYVAKEWYNMIPPQVWTKIFKKDIILRNNLKFINVAREGNLFNHKYQYYCNKISIINRALVNYRLFSDISKHSSAGLYYKKTDILYEIIYFRDQYIAQNGAQRTAWDLYLARFIIEIYNCRTAEHPNDANSYSDLDNKKEFSDIIARACIDENIQNLSQDIYTGVKHIEHELGITRSVCPQNPVDDSVSKTSIHSPVLRALMSKWARAMRDRIGQG